MLCPRAVAFYVVLIAPTEAFAPSQFGVFLSAGCVYLSFTPRVGGASTLIGSFCKTPLERAPHRGARSCPPMLAVALSCVAWQAHQAVPRRLLSGASSETAKVPKGYPGIADKSGAAGMPRVVGASTINRMRPVDMALGKDMLELALRMPLDEALPLAQSRLGVVCCYALPHIACVFLLGTIGTTDASELTGWTYVGGFIMYAVVINAVGGYIANLDIFTSQVVGGSNLIASTFGALCSRAVAFYVVLIAPTSTFAPSKVGFFLSAGCVYLSFTIGVGGYLSEVLFPLA